MTRCIVNVATGFYVPLQRRLSSSLDAAGWRQGRVLWTDRLPPGSPPHAEAPYAFKLHAIRAAFAAGHRSVLWLDAPCIVTRALTPVFEAIERDGHLLVSSGGRLGNWASDGCLSAHGLTRDAAMAVELMNGALIGLDLANARASRWFEELWLACEQGLFAGAYLTEHAPPAVRARKPGKPAGFVSPDPRCWGHGHDESAGSCLAHRLGLPLTVPGPLFSARAASGVIEYARG